MREEFITLSVSHGQADEMRTCAEYLANIEAKDGREREELQDLFAEIASAIEFSHDHSADVVTVEIPFDETSARAVGRLLMEYGYGEGAP